MAISFEILLIVEVLGITTVLLWLFGRALKSSTRVPGFGPALSQKLAPLLVVLVLVAAYYMTPDVGQARYLYFLTESIVLAVATVLVLSGKSARRAQYAIILVICITILNGLMTKAFLGGVIWGLDERGYMLDVLRVGSTGHFFLGDNPYYQVPEVPQVLYTLSAITSMPLDVVVTTISSVFMLIFQAAVYLISTHMTRDLRAVFVVELITIFTPRLVLTQVVQPEALSLVFAISMLYLIARIILGDSLSPRRDFAIAMLLFVAIVLTHPSGVIVVMTLMALLTVGYALRVPIRNAGFKLGFLRAPARYPIARVLLILLATTAAAYWISLPGTGKSVLVNQLSQFFSALVPRGPPNAFTSYVPLYTSSGLQYTLLWALPLALSSGYYLRKLASREHEEWSKQESLGLLCYVGGALLVLGSYAILATSSTSTADRYLGSPGYLLIVLSLTLPVSVVLLNSRRGLVLALLVLLVGVTAIGPSLPDISPDAHSAIFEPFTASSIQFYATSLKMYSANSTTVIEKDFGDPISLQTLLEAQNTNPISASYKVTRDILGELAQGTANISDFKTAFFTVDTSLLPGFLPQVGNASDIYLSSGRFIIVRY